MKAKLLLLFLLVSLFANSQNYLGCSKSYIRHNMKEYDLTVKAANYLEYQQDSIAIGYFFEDYYCTCVLLTLTRHQAVSFEASKSCRWQPCGDGYLWDYEGFEAPVLIRKYDQGLTITFEYTFKEEVR